MNERGRSIGGVAMTGAVRSATVTFRSTNLPNETPHAPAWK